MNIIINSWAVPITVQDTLGAAKTSESHDKGFQMDTRTIAVISVIAVAPLAIVILIALLRGYKIDLHMRREGKGEDNSSQKE